MNKESEKTHDALVTDIIPDNKARANAIFDEKVESGELPRYLFKYHSADDDDASEEKRYTELLVKTQQLRFANARTFNDPFDGQLVPVIDDTLEEIQERFLKLFRNVYRHGNPDASESDIDAQAIPSAMKAAAEKYENKDQNKEFGERWLLKIMFANYKISCFSENPNNILLWSHYAKNHTGICLKFDVLADKDFFRGMIKVNYKKKYPYYNIHRNKLKGVIETMLCTKAKIWKYEREWRLIKTNETQTNEAGQLITTMYHNFQFNKLALIEIVFGCNASAIFINRIKDAARGAGLENVSFKKARVSETEFKLEFDSI